MRMIAVSDRPKRSAFGRYRSLPFLSDVILNVYDVGTILYVVNAQLPGQYRIGHLPRARKRRQSSPPLPARSR